MYTWYLKPNQIEFMFGLLSGLSFQIHFGGWNHSAAPGIFLPRAAKRSSELCTPLLLLRMKALPFFLRRKYLPSARILKRTWD